MPSTPSDIIGSLIAAASPAVSPDGRQVAFSTSRVDLEANAYRTQLWLAPVDGSAPARPLTAGLQKDASPTWSPDGRRLAFTSHRGGSGETTLHVLPADGPGETTTIATRKEPINDLAWSPDGTMIAFVSRHRSEAYAETDVTKQGPRQITTFYSKSEGLGWVHDRPEHIWVVPADGTAHPEDLTPGDHEFRAPSWLPDCSGVVVSGEGHETWDVDLAIDLYLVGLDASRERLTHGTGSYHLPAVSPDGSRIAFLGYDQPMLYPQNTAVGVLDRSTGAHVYVSTGLDRSFSPTAGMRSPIWHDGHLLATAEDRGSTRLFRVDPSGSRAPEPLTATGCVVPSFHAGGGTVAVTLATETTPAELHLVTSGGMTRPVTHLTDRRTARLAPRPMHHFLAPSSGGVEVDTWVLTPPDFDPAGSYPVLLNVHGGPFTQYGYTYFDEVQLQAAAGFVVVMSNPRGSSGRDTDWGQAIAGPQHPLHPGTGWGSVDVEDVLAALDEALRRFPAADGSRVGMLGGSYGGYMASWLAGHHGDRFAAFCSERAVNNLLSEEWNSDIATMFRIEHGPTHLEAPEEYLRMSPITYVDQMTKPMLIIHSENDYRCPITQAEELFVALRMLGRDVEFFRFPNEGHELTRSGSPVHRVQRAELILRFFRQHLTPAV